jgi:hypothetical protein
MLWKPRTILCLSIKTDKGCPVKNKLFASTIITLTLITLAFFPFDSSADTLLDVPEIAQKHSQWCWAGSSEATLEYYTTLVSQCDVAN